MMQDLSGPQVIGRRRKNAMRRWKFTSPKCERMWSRAWRPAGNVRPLSISLYCRKYKAKDNLTAGDRSALKALMAREDVVIKPADKGSGVVVLGKAGYLQEAESQLGNGSHYHFLDIDPLDETAGVVAAKVHDLHARKIFNKHTQRFLLPREPGLASFICCLRFISLEIQEGQQWTVSSTTRWRKTSRSMSIIFSSLWFDSSRESSKTRPTSWINWKPSQRGKRAGSWSLWMFHPCIQTFPTSVEEGIEACRSAAVLNQRSVCDRPTEDLCSLIEVIFRNNVFGFKNKCYHQVHGTAMGTKMAPAYAKPFMSGREQRFVNTQTTKPGVWWRFLDDIFSIWTHRRASLDTFLVAINQAHPTIKFT